MDLEQRYQGTMAKTLALLALETPPRTCVECGMSRPQDRAWCQDWVRRAGGLLCPDCAERERREAQEERCVRDAYARQIHEENLARRAWEEKHAASMHKADLLALLGRRAHLGSQASPVRQPDIAPWGADWLGDALCALDRGDDPPHLYGGIDRGDHSWCERDRFAKRRAIEHWRMMR